MTKFPRVFTLGQSLYQKYFEKHQLKMSNWYLEIECHNLNTWNYDRNVGYMQNIYIYIYIYMRLHTANETENTNRRTIRFFKCTKSPAVKKILHL